MGRALVDELDQDASGALDLYEFSVFIADLTRLENAGQPPPAQNASAKQAKPFKTPIKVPITNKPRPKKSAGNPERLLAKNASHLQSIRKLIEMHGVSSVPGADLRDFQERLTGLEESLVRIEAAVLA